MAESTIPKPLEIDAGYISASTSVTASSVKTVNVSFNKTFSDTPRVVVCLYSSSDSSQFGLMSVVADSITTTGFKAKFCNADTTNRLIGARWIAVLV